MPSYLDFRQDDVEGTVEVRGMEIRIRYNPDDIRVRDVDLLMRGRREQDISLMTRGIKTFISEWDVTGPLVDIDTDEVLVEDGEVIPFEVRCMEVLGFAFLTEFIDNIETEVTKGPDPTTAKAPSRKPSRGRQRTRTTTKRT